jgi:hypothetical protein
MEKQSNQEKNPQQKRQIYLNLKWNKTKASKKEKYILRHVSHHGFGLVYDERGPNHLKRKGELHGTNRTEKGE